MNKAIIIITALVGTSVAGFYITSQFEEIEYDSEFSVVVPVEEITQEIEIATSSEEGIVVVEPVIPTPAPTPVVTPVVVEVREEEVVETVTEKLITYMYKNGFYSTNLNYTVPEGHTEEITVSVTVFNDELTSIVVVHNDSNRESRQYQSRFKKSFSSSSITGAMEDIPSLSRTGGASLTTKAFNKAIKDLKSQAVS